MYTARYIGHHKKDTRGMDVVEAIRARRTVHLYQPGEIEQATLREALELALCAPNHKFTFPWKFTLVGPQTRQALQVFAKTLKMAGKTLSEDEEAALDRKLQAKMGNPAGLVVFSVERSEDDFRQREDYATVACSIQNFTLALAAKGYGTKWGTGGITREDEAYRILQIDRSAFDIIGFLWVGHSSVGLPPQKRPSLESVLDVLP